MMNAELAEYFKSIGITQEDIANRLGVSQQYVSALLSGKSAFGKKQAQRFQEIWGIQSSWLLTGEGDMLAKRRIPLYDTPTIGGVNEMAAPVDEAAAPSEWIDAGDWFPTATSAIHHYGESMVEYPSGCILVLKRVNDPRLLINGEVYVVETSEYRITKQLQDDGDHITAYSTNRETYPDGRLVHAPITIPKEEIRHLDLVLGCVIRKFSQPIRIK
jgi:transcriptional regulator with XRE-family HTH domain